MSSVLLFRAAALGALITVGCAQQPADEVGDTALPVSAAAADLPPNADTVPVRPSAPAPGARPAASPPRATADTLRGVPAVVGTEHDMRVMLRRDGAASVLLAGSHVAALRRTVGADVWVTGTRESDGRFTVTGFAVRSVDGAPALDGVLREENGRLVLVTADGRRRPVNNPPDALRDHAGSRVWVTGLERGPVTFGVIEPRR